MSIKLIYNKNNTLDYDSMLTDGMSDKNIKVINKYSKAKDSLLNKKRNKYYNHYDKKPEKEAINLNKRAEAIKKPMPTLKKRLLQKGTIKPEKKNKDIINDSPIIKEMPNDTSEDIFIKNQIINNINMSLDNYNEAQIINTYSTVNKYGKNVSIVTGNTRKADTIRQLPFYSFGSIDEYNINTLPKSYLSRYGVEKFELFQSGNYNGKSLISRRYLCDILNTWCKILKIPYKQGVKMWCIDIEQVLITGKTKKYTSINGEIAIRILKDILFLMRNKSFKSITKYAKKEKVSQQLHNYIKGLTYDRVSKDYIKGLKDNLYFTLKANDIVWAIPKYSPDYIIKHIKLLQSGKYLTDIYVPIINNLTKFPIKCTDMTVKPMTNDEHDKNSDDYDIGKYIWEDY